MNKANGLAIPGCCHAVVGLHHRPAPCGALLALAVGCAQARVWLLSDVWILYKSWLGSIMFMVWAGPTRIPAALGAFLAPSAGLRAGWGWAAASLAAPAADSSVTAGFVLAGERGCANAAIRGFQAKVRPCLMPTLPYPTLIYPTLPYPTKHNHTYTCLPPARCVQAIARTLLPSHGHSLEHLYR